MGEGARQPEARCHRVREGVDATGGWGEGHASYPRRPACLPQSQAAREGGAMGMQESAEAVVVAVQRDEGRTDRPEAVPSLRGEGGPRRAQAHPAGGDNAVDEGPRLLEKAIEEQQPLAWTI